MNKLIIGSFLAIGMLLGCKKKEQVEKEPEEYFSFTANGVDYYYPQDISNGLWNSRKAIFAVSSHNTGFFMEASSFSDPAALGTFRFTFFPTDEIPQEDTIILDGMSNSAVIEWFLNQDAYYKLLPPQQGRIIFTERTEKRLSGIFKFDATLTTTPMSGPTDSIIHITNGKFSIKPTLQNE